ncbi:MAG: MFS transporter [Paludibacteraceae bacterium]|nr:MFS transporter [Paludibacteraceae bacterium]
MEQKKKSYLFPICIMFALCFMIAFVTNLAGSMGIIVQDQFNTSNALSQLGTLANFIAYACMGIPGGILLKKKGYKVTALTAIVFGLVGVGIQFISGYAQSFAIYVVGAFISGFSMCLLNIVVMPMLNLLGGGGNKGNQMIQFGNTFNSLGGTLAPILLGYLMGTAVGDTQVSDAAPAMIIALSIFALALIVIACSSIPEPYKEKQEQTASNQKDKHSPFSFVHFVLGAIAIFFYVGIEVGIPNTANLYMSNNPQVGPVVAGSLVGLYWLLMMVGRLIGGLVGAKVSSKTMLTVVSSLAILLVLCIIFVPANLVTIPYVGNVPLNMVCMVACGLCTSIMWGAIFNLSTEGLGKYTPMATGIFMTLVCGGGVLPYVQNVLADVPSIGYLGSYVLIAVALLYLLMYALIGSKNRNTDIIVD